MKASIYIQTDITVLLIAIYLLLVDDYFITW